MAAKHTPGPWVHDTNGHPGPDVRATSGRAVAATWMVCKNVPKTTEGFKARQDEDRANARLIAAAPCLLEALQAAYDALGISYPLHSSDMDKRGAILAQARAAIAKATGEGA